jgi:hypothetical protein
MPLILGTNSIKDTGYDVANSLRFNDGSSDSLTKSFSGSGNRKTWTLSVWFKLGLIPPASRLFSIGNDASSDILSIFFTSGDLRFENTVSGSHTLEFRTDQVFRDPSAWSHLVFAVDTTQSTSSDRVKIYHNGSQITSFSTENYPSQNSDTLWNHTTGSATIGARAASSSGTFFDGYMAEIVSIDGQQLDPTSFGEFDSDSPTIWKPIDVSGLTFGTNGFHLDFENASSLGADVSGNSNNFTVNNLTSVDQSTDTCTNNACTWNILYRNQATFTNGNLTYQAPSSNPVFGSLTTFGVDSGKWYAECKYHAGSNHFGIIGIADEVFATLSDLGSATNTDLGKTGSALGSHPNDCTVAYVINTGKIRNNNNNQDYGSGGGDGDIINIALDRDNRKVYFGINGTYENSGNPSSGSNGFDLSSQVTGNTYFLGVTNDTGSSETILDFNFGGGFGQTAVSSGNSDANGHGNFEYAVPTGFFAWNSKNLAEFG